MNGDEGIMGEKLPNIILTTKNCMAFKKYLIPNTCYKSAKDQTLQIDPTKTFDIDMILK